MPVQPDVTLDDAAVRLVRGVRVLIPGDETLFVVDTAAPAPTASGRTCASMILPFPGCCFPAGL